MKKSDGLEAFLAGMLAALILIAFALSLLSS